MSNEDVTMWIISGSDCDNLDKAGGTFFPSILHHINFQCIS